jgi:hypothetical protein
MHKNEKGLPRDGRAGSGGQARKRSACAFKDLFLRSLKVVEKALQ